MGNAENNTNFNKDINYYEIKLKLEQYKETVNNITTVQNIEGIILQIKSYIFSNEILRKCFIEQVNLFSGTCKTPQKRMSFYKDFEETYITPIVTNAQNPPDSAFSIPNLLYFSVVPECLNNISEFTERHQNNFIGVLDLYRRLNGANLDIDFWKKYTREVLNSLDFYIFSQLETSYLYEFISTTWSDSLSLYSPAFNLIWAKSITIGVLHKLLMLISNIYIPQYYNKAFQKITKPKHTLVCIKDKDSYTIKLNDEVLNNLKTPVSDTLIALISNRNVNANNISDTNNYFKSIIGENIIPRKRKGQPYRINENIIKIKTD